MIGPNRRLAALAALLLASACGATPGGSEGGPDRGPVPLTERGIGGTGAPSRDADRGIGGTGVETGIVGAITGFGSIKVDGFEIADDTIRDVLVDAERRSVRTLRVGQIARIVATGDATALRAVSVAVEHAVVGPVQLVLAPDLFVVAGQTVRVMPGTVGEMPRLGRFVAVSGLRDSGATIRATRLDPMAPGEVIVTGRLVATPSGWRIGRLPVIAPPGDLAGAARGEARVRVVGRLGRLALLARSILPAPLVAGAAGPDRIVLQAFVSPLGDDVLIGDGASAARGPNLGALPPDRAVVVALTRAADGRLTATEFLGAGGGGGGGRGGGASSATPDPARASAANAAPAIDRAPAPGATAGPGAAPGGFAGGSAGAIPGLGASAAPTGSAGVAGPATAGPRADAAAVGSPPSAASTAGAGGVADRAGGFAAGAGGGVRDGGAPGGAPGGAGSNGAGPGGSGPGGAPRR